MLEEIKKELLKNPEKLKMVLEAFDYCGVVVHSNYISCGRDQVSSKKSIVIWLDDNPFLFVKDYARVIDKDLFSYIMSQRGVDFKTVLQVVKATLGISDYYSHFYEKRTVFGGFYDKVKRQDTRRIITYEDSVLEEFERLGNIRFLKDHISLEAQKFFHLGYDAESQGITIPIYDQIGQVMGIKVRANHDINEEAGELKYYYILPCAMSQTLYGYAQNYEYLVGDEVYVLEAEKSVMQCYSYGFRNCVALGSGTISKKQVQMLLELQPKKIIFLHDVGFKKEYIDRNIQMVKAYSRFSEAKIGYWDYKEEDYKNKVSPSDMGREKFLYILKNEITMLEEPDEEI